MMWKTAVGQRFHDNASTYDQYALVQMEMAQRLYRLLCTWAGNRKVEKLLEVGCGTGGLTRLVRRSFPDAHYQALDLAQGMLDKARTRLNQEGLDCRFLCADVEEWVWQQEEKSHDLIASSACFQWLSQPAVTLRGLFRMLRPGASLFFSTFGPRTFTELHESFAQAHAVLGQDEVRHGLSFHSASDWKAMLLSAGFDDCLVTSQQVKLYYPGVREFLRAVKAVGANASQEKAPGLGSRRLLAEMIRYYEDIYGSEKGIPVTYDLIYIHGTRGKVSFYTDKTSMSRSRHY